MGMIPSLSIGMKYKLTNSDSPIKLRRMKRKAVPELKHPIRISTYLSRATEKELEKICALRGIKPALFLRELLENYIVESNLKK